MLFALNAIYVFTKAIWSQDQSLLPPVEWERRGGIEVVIKEKCNTCCFLCAFFFLNALEDKLHPLGFSCYSTITAGTRLFFIKDLIAQSALPEHVLNLICPLTQWDCCFVWIFFFCMCFFTSLHDRDRQRSFIVYLFSPTVILRSFYPPPSIISVYVFLCNFNSSELQDVLNFHPHILIQHSLALFIPKPERECNHKWRLSSVQSALSRPHGFGNEMEINFSLTHRTSVCYGVSLLPKRAQYFNQWAGFLLPSCLFCFYIKSIR